MYFFRFGIHILRDLQPRDLGVSAQKTELDALWHFAFLRFGPGLQRAKTDAPVLAKGHQAPGNAHRIFRCALHLLHIRQLLPLGGGVQRGQRRVLVETGGKGLHPQSPHLGDLVVAFLHQSIHQ